MVMNIQILKFYQILKNQVVNTPCKRKTIENVSTRPKETEIVQNSQINPSDITISGINIK